MNYYAASAIFNGLLALFLAYYVFLRNKKSPLNRSFLYFGIIVGGWSLIYALWCWAENAQKAEFYTRLHMTFAVFIPAGYLHFVARFTATYKTSMRWPVALVYGICLIYAFLSHTNLMISGVKEILFFPHWPCPGPLTFPYVIFATVVTSFTFLILLRYALKAHGMERKKSFWLLFAFGLGFSGGWMNWFLWFDILVPPTTNFFIGVTFVLITYAIVRYGLMDIDVLVDLIRNNRLFNMGMLISSINHEIKNPLYIIQGVADSFLATQGEKRCGCEGEQRASSLLKKTSEQASRAIDIMKKFSEFAKLKSGGKLEVKPIDIPQVLSSVLPLVRHELELSRVRLVEKLPADLPAVRADFCHLEEIFLNLLVNSCQAMKKTGGGTITVEGRQRGDFVQITIADDGPGIPKDQLKQLFTPFYTTRQEGSGLGLYITRQLIEKNGGAIAVTSAQGKGVSFALGLPVSTNLEKFR